MKYKYLMKELLNWNKLRLYNKCKQLKVKNYSKLKKEDLIKLIIQYYALKKLQYYFRQYLAVDNICLFSSKPFTYPCWSKKTQSGHRYYYNLKPLIKYIYNSGEKALDPITKEPYTIHEIESINKLYKTTNLPKKLGISNLNIIYKRKVYYRKQKDNEEQINILIDFIRSDIINVKEYIETLINEYYDLNISHCINEIERRIDYIFNTNFKYLEKKSKEWANKTYIMMFTIINNINTSNVLKVPAIEYLKTKKK